MKIIFGGIFLIILLIGLMALRVFRKQSKLSQQDSQHIQKKIQESKALQNPSQQIIQYDNIYHNTLKYIGYQGSFGSILKSKPKEIANLDLIWSLHKLRNQLVHELYTPDPIIMLKKAKIYQKQLDILLRSLS